MQLVPRRHRRAVALGISSSRRHHQAAFLEQQRVSLERFARQQERAVRQLEARQQAARDEAAQAERELTALRAQSAEAEIRRDQEAARWKLELAAGYETQIKVRRRTEVQDTGRDAGIDGRQTKVPVETGPSSISQPPSVGRQGNGAMTQGGEDCLGECGGRLGQSGARQG